MLSDSWDIRPRDWVECLDGRRGMVLSTCRTILGVLICVEVGFEWVGVDQIAQWVPEN